MCDILPALACSLLLAAGAAAQQPQVPAGATPGAALPDVPATEPAVPSDDASMFPIPPAVERPLNVEEGERLFVSRFTLDGVTDRPDRGVVLGDLEELLENLRVETLSLNKVDEYGFTDAERQEIAAFMQAVVGEGDLDMRFEDYEALVDKLRAIKEQRDSGMTIGQMQEIAAAVTQYYRDAGYVLAQAFIPAQEVSEGVVVIEVLEGRLGNVLTEGNEKYSSEILARPFDDLIDSPVSGEEVQSAILSVSDYPGLAVFGVFQPGRQVGTTDLVLRVQEERTFDATVRYDNHGSRFTGERRIFTELAYNNLTGGADRLSATYLKQFWPQKSVFGKLEYVRPVALPGLSIGGYYQRNPFDVGAELRSAELSGDTKEGQVYTRYQMIRSLDANAAARVGWKRSQSVTKQNSRDIFKDELSMLEAELTFDTLDREGRAVNVGSIGLDVGLGSLFGGNGNHDARNQIIPPSRTGGSGRVASNSFTKFFGTFSRLQKVTENQSVLVRLEGQYSAKLLTSTEQFSLGGPSSVRAYNPSEFLADLGFFGAFEYSFNAPGFSDSEFREGLTWGDVLRVSFFMDYGWGKVTDPAATDESVIQILGAGSGVTFDLPGTFTGRLQYAYPLTYERVPGDPGDREKGKWWFDFTYQF